MCSVYQEVVIAEGRMVQVYIVNRVEWGVDPFEGERLVRRFLEDREVEGYTCTRDLLRTTCTRPGSPKLYASWRPDGFLDMAMQCLYLRVRYGVVNPICKQLLEGERP